MQCPQGIAPLVPSRFYYLRILLVHASKRNEYQEYFLRGKGGRCVGLTILPFSFANCLEIWEPQTPGTSGPFLARIGIALLLLSAHSKRIYY